MVVWVGIYFRRHRFLFQQKQKGKKNWEEAFLDLFPFFPLCILTLFSFLKEDHFDISFFFHLDPHDLERMPIQAPVAEQTATTATNRKSPAHSSNSVKMKTEQSKDSNQRDDNDQNALTKNDEYVFYFFLISDQINDHSSLR